MPTPSSLKAPFLPESFYHIVCKSVDGLFLFYDDNDYEVFLHRFKKFTDGLIDVWGYCLLKNHTHQVIKTKTVQSINSYINNLPLEYVTKAMERWREAQTEPLQSNEDELFHLFDEMLERQMNSFLVSYANYFNQKYDRKGGLFQKPFKRIQITDDGYLQQAIIYTHANAQKHGLINDFCKYSFSSYNTIINKENRFVDGEKVLAFFGSTDKYVQTHTEQVRYFYLKGWPSSKLE